jgi:hypothetical protein
MTWVLARAQSTAESWTTFIRAGDRATNFLAGEKILFQPAGQRKRPKLHDAPATRHREERAWHRCTPLAVESRRPFIPNIAMPNLKHDCRSVFFEPVFSDDRERQARKSEAKWAFAKSDCTELEANTAGKLYFVSNFGNPKQVTLVLFGHHHFCLARRVRQFAADPLDESRRGAAPLRGADFLTDSALNV